MSSHPLFPTDLWGFRYTHHQHQRYDYVQHILNRWQTEPSVSKSNSGGWQSDDDLNTVPVFRELFSHIINTCDQITSEYTGTHRTGFIQSAWANVNHQHHFNYEHTHEGDLSGVLYLTVPENSGRLIMVNPAVRASSGLFRQPNFPVTPEPLALIIFPSWLSHYVEPNASTEPRISISFNYEVKR